MNRREVIHLAGSVAFGLAAQSKAEPMPASVAGVRLVDSKVAKAATEFSRSVSTPSLFNHTVRTYLFGSLSGRAQGLKFDEELLYLACILHDLGLTEKYQGNLPFELQGAQTAKKFLDEQAFAKEKIAIVWDGIAMHASPIGQFKQPEIALVGDGAGSDVIAPDPAHIKKEEVDEIVKAFPRLKFKEAFLSSCADVARKHPRAAGQGFMRDVRERYVPDFNPAGNFCDLVEKAPFAE